MKEDLDTNVTHCPWWDVILFYVAFAVKFPLLTNLLQHCCSDATVLNGIV